MLTIKQLRQDIGADGQKVLSHIWRLFLDRKEWPSTRLVHRDLGKPFVASVFAKTNGSVVSEGNNGGTSFYQLNGVGPLLTDDGPEYQELLLRYFEYLRELYNKSPEQNSIDSEDFLKAISLPPDKSLALYHVISLGRLFSSGAGSRADGWNVGVLKESEDFPDGSLDAILETLLLRTYNPVSQIYYQDQISGLSRPRQIPDTFDEKIVYYTELLRKSLETYEKEHPDLQTQCLYWVMERSLHQLRSYLEQSDAADNLWNEPFIELHFPIDCQWKTDDVEHSFTFNAGVLTKENLKDEASAVKTLAQIMIRQIEIVVLQEVTHFSAYAKDGNGFRVMLNTETINRLESLASGEERDSELRSLLQPCSFGAGTIEFPEDIEEGDPVPESVLIQLSKVRPPLVSLPMPSGHDEAAVMVIFEVHPLVVDFAKQVAYFPLTIGLTVLLDNPSLEVAQTPPWMRLAKMSPDERGTLWDSLFSIISQRVADCGPKQTGEIEEAIVIVNAKIRMKASDQIDIEDLQRSALEQLQAMGSVLEFDTQLFRGLTTTPEVKSLAALQELDAAKTNDEKGKSLEKLMKILFGSIDGFGIQERVRSETEEMDLVIVNTGDVPTFRKEGPILLVECKNWSKKCGKDEFVLFQSKMANRGERCTLGFLVSWNGFANTFTKEMLRASRERLVIVPLDGAQIRAAVQANNFLKCIQDEWTKSLLV